jgi:hypothetical protein
MSYAKPWWLPPPLPRGLPRAVAIWMQLRTGAELFGNLIVQYSQLTSKYHIGA